MLVVAAILSFMVFGQSNRLSNIDDQLAALAAANEQSPVAGQIDTLAADIEALRARAIPEPFDPADLVAQLDGLKGQLAALAVRAIESNSTDYVFLGEVFFEVGSYQLSTDQRNQIRSLFEGVEDGEVSLIGSTDRTGNTEFNAILSLLRATSVQAAIVSEFVNKIELISIDGVGEIGAPIPTPDNTSEARNRRVGIYFQAR